MYKNKHEDIEEQLCFINLDQNLNSHQMPARSDSLPRNQGAEQGFMPSPTPPTPLQDPRNLPGVQLNLLLRSVIWTSLSNA